MALSHLDVMTIVTVVAAMTLQCFWSAYSASGVPTVDVGISLNHAVQSGPPRALEAPKANTKSRAHNTECARGVWGHAPQEIYML